jgi:hypothetical protein
MEDLNQQQLVNINASEVVIKCRTQEDICNFSIGSLKLGKIYA